MSQLTGKSVYSSLEFSQMFGGRRSLQTPSPTTSGAYSLTSDPALWEQLACCYIKTSRGYGQGVLVHLDFLQDRPLALLTDHHIVPTMEEARGLVLRFSQNDKHAIGDKPQNKIAFCISCCGPYGVFQGDVHAALSTNGTNVTSTCPMGDFTVLVLKQEFGSRILKKEQHLYVPQMVDLDLPSLEQALQNNRCYVVQRNELGHATRDEVKVQRIAAAREEKSLESDVVTYKENCLIRYPVDGFIGRGSSGAAIICSDPQKKCLMLLGIHTSTAQDDSMHYGIAVHTIFHPIAGGPMCGIIPSLSLLRDAHLHKRQQVRWYENLKACLEQGGTISLEHLLKIVDFLLRAEPHLLMLCHNDPPGLVKASLKLLEVIFGLFEEMGGATAVHAKALEVFANEAVALQESVENTCLHMCELLNEAYEHKNIELVGALCSCWPKMRHFGEPVWRILYNSAKLSKWKQIREDESYNPNPTSVPSLFGDICLAYQGHLMNNMHDKLEKERDELHGQFEQEKRDLEAKLQLQAHQFEQEKQQIEERVKEQLGVKEREMREQVEAANERAGVAERRAQELEETIGQTEERTREVEERLEEQQRALEESNQLLEQQRNETQDLHEVSEREASDKAEVIRELTNANETLSITNQSLEDETEQLKHERRVQDDAISRLKEQLKMRDPSSGRHMSLPSQSTASLYPTRQNQTSLLPLQPQGDFNSWDMEKLLQKDTNLRDEIADRLRKIHGGRDGNWEDLIKYLEENLWVQMDASQLEGLLPGEILVSIVKAWGNKEKVTVARFCEVLRDKLNLPRVEGILREAAEAYLQCTFGNEHPERDSDHKYI